MSVIINGIKIRGENLIGKQFTKLSVLDLEGLDNSNHPMWKCKCECGNECVIRADLLKSEKTKSCGCLAKLAQGESSFNSLYSRYIKQANERGYEFNLSKDEFRLLTKKNCYYCDIEPSQECGSINNNGSYTYNGIDRLDNTQGYIIGNVVSCCKNCNRSKDVLDFDQFKKLIRRIYVNLHKKISDKTPGELIDSLITVDIKCFMFQEKMLDKNLSEQERLKTAEIVLELNKKRNLLMRSIDALLDFQADTVTPKTYLSNQKEDISAEF